MHGAPGPGAAPLLGFSPPRCGPQDQAQARPGQGRRRLPGTCCPLPPAHCAAGTQCSRRPPWPGSGPGPEPAYQQPRPPHKQAAPGARPARHRWRWGGYRREAGTCSHPRGLARALQPSRGTPLPSSPLGISSCAAQFLCLSFPFCEMGAAEAATSALSPRHSQDIASRVPRPRPRQRGLCVSPLHTHTCHCREPSLPSFPVPKSLRVWLHPRPQPGPTAPGAVRALRRSGVGSGPQRETPGTVGETEARPGSRGL